MEEKKFLKEKGKFVANELVLCYEPDPVKAKVLYDAKVLDIDLTKDDKGRKVYEYYIHFQGWNKSWDRWILEDKILKDNETSRAFQSKLLKDAIKPKKRKRKITKSEGNESEEKLDEEVTKPDLEEEVKVIQLPPVSLDIPKTLVNKLEDDCYNIKRRKKLIHLPRTPSVATILSDYYDHCKRLFKKQDGRDISLTIIEELIDGLTVYFNFYLSTLLLYNFEREQYHKFFPIQKPPLHLIALHSATPPVTPLFSPKLSSIVALDKSMNESKESSRSNSRSSSFSEDAPLSSVVDKSLRTRGRSSSCRRSSASFDNKDWVCGGKRIRTDSNSSSINPLSPESPMETNLPSSSETPSKRETRSSRNNSVSRVTEIKQESIELPASSSATKGDVDKSSATSRLRRSARLPKIISTPPQKEQLLNSMKQTGSSGLDITKQSDQVSPLKTKMVDSNLKQGASQSNLLKPLTIQTDIPSAHGRHDAQPPSKDHSFFMYPVGIDKTTTPMDVYGPEHFLRLFVKLPVLLASSNIEQPKLSVILRNVSKLLDYIANRTDLFEESVYSESVL